MTQKLSKKEMAHTIKRLERTIQEQNDVMRRSPRWKDNQRLKKQDTQLREQLIAISQYMKDIATYKEVISYIEASIDLEEFKSDQTPNLSKKEGVYYRNLLKNIYMYFQDTYPNGV